jgi:phosphoribosylformylglycinamidine (FGAM) synthase-like amidotransferase family enzyme
MIPGVFSAGDHLGINTTWTAGKMLKLTVCRGFSYFREANNLAFKMLRHFIENISLKKH